MEIRDLLGSNDADKPFVPNFPVWKDTTDETNNNNQINGAGSQFLYPSSQTLRGEQPNPFFSQQLPGQGQPQLSHIPQIGQHTQPPQISPQQIFAQHPQMQQIHQQQQHQQPQQPQQTQQIPTQQLLQHQLQPSQSQLMLQQVQMKSQMALNNMLGNSGGIPNTNGSTSPTIGNISANTMQKIQHHFQQQQQHQLLQFTQLQLQQQMLEQQSATFTQQNLDPHNVSTFDDIINYILFYRSSCHFGLLCLHSNLIYSQVQSPHKHLSHPRHISPHPFLLFLHFPQQQTSQGHLQHLDPFLLPSTPQLLSPLLLLFPLLLWDQVLYLHHQDHHHLHDLKLLHNLLLLLHYLPLLLL